MIASRPRQHDDANDDNKNGANDNSNSSPPSSSSSSSAPVPSSTPPAPATQPTPTVNNDSNSDNARLPPLCLYQRNPVINSTTVTTFPSAHNKPPPDHHRLHFRPHRFTHYPPTLVATPITTTLLYHPPHLPYHHRRRLCFLRRLLRRVNHVKQKNASSKRVKKTTVNIVPFDLPLVSETVSTHLVPHLDLPTPLHPLAPACIFVQPVAIVFQRKEK